MCNGIRVEVASSGMGRNRTEPTCIELSAVDSRKNDLDSSARQEEYHAAVSVEFDGDGMGQTNNNNIVSGEYHAAVFVEFDGDWTDKQH